MKLLLALAIFFTFFSCSDKHSVDNEAKVGSQTLPSYFDNGDRIFLHIPTISKDTITVFTDTGGGFTAIYPKAITTSSSREKLAVVNMDGASETIIYASDIISDEAYFPYLNTTLKKIVNKPFFFVPSHEFVKQNGEDSNDGFFGQFFFMNKVWTFDYPQQKVILHHEKTLSKTDDAVEKIGLKKDLWRKPKFGHPSFTMEVRGEKIPMLFDTGATFHLSENAQNILNRPQKIGGSFIARSQYNTWKKENPTWSTIEEGDIIKDNGNDYTFDMIEVPIVKLGEIEVGPVWFSVRPDQAWSKGMIKTMDKVVMGALGGSALKYLSVTIDYKNELLRFHE